MAQGDGNGVRRVVRFGHGFQPQQALGHIHDLTFFRLTVTHDRHLDLRGVVFIDRDPLPLRRHQNDPAGLATPMPVVTLLPKVEPFHRHGIRIELSDQLIQIVRDLKQPLGQG